MKRYGLSEVRKNGEYLSEMRENKFGDYVKYEDVEKLVKALKNISITDACISCLEFGYTKDDETSTQALARQTLKELGVE